MDVTEARDPDEDMTGQDPLSSAAEGDDDPGSAALAGDRDEDQDPGHTSFAEAGPPPEAADGTPVTDAAPDTYLGEQPDA